MKTNHLLLLTAGGAGLVGYGLAENEVENGGSTPLTISTATAILIGMVLLAVVVYFHLIKGGK